MYTIVNPTRRASSMSLRRLGTIAIAALTSSPRLAALPCGLTKSFCTSTTINAAYLGSHRSFKLLKISTVHLVCLNRGQKLSILNFQFSIFSMVVFPLQAAMAHRHDVGATDFFPGKQTRQEHVEGRERIMQHATRKTHDRSFIEISHDKHRAGQHGKAMSFHFGAASANAVRRLVVGIDRHAAADENYISPGPLG